MISHSINADFLDTSSKEEIIYPLIDHEQLQNSRRLSLSQIEQEKSKSQLVEISDGISSESEQEQQSSGNKKQHSDPFKHS